MSYCVVILACAICMPILLGFWIVVGYQIAKYFGVNFEGVE